MEIFWTKCRDIQQLRRVRVAANVVLIVEYNVYECQGLLVLVG